MKKARSIARAHQLPWIGIHHMEAHALVTRLYSIVRFNIVLYFNAAFLSILKLMYVHICWKTVSFLVAFRLSDKQIEFPFLVLLISGNLNFDIT